VRGVRLGDGSILPAAVVVDATGRRSRAPEWLVALGAPAPHERSAETGILYYTRFYRLRRARAPRGGTGLVAGDLKWVKIAIFPGDNGTFSITVGAPVGERALRGLADPRRFERFLRAFPAVAPWRTDGASVPIAGAATPVLAMGQLRNRLRRFVDAGGRPLATGFFAIGDAAYHSNPVYGRGAPSALVQATLLDEALARHPRDLAAAALHLDRRSEAELRPFWDAAVAGDRHALGDRRALRLGNPRAWLLAMAEQAFGWFVDKAIVPATRVDPVVFRGLIRVFNMLDAPDRLLRDPELLLRTLPVLARVLRGNEPQPLFPPVPRAAAMARSSAAYRRAAMCRNIKTLHNFKPPATDEEIRASALQFVRKLSGFTRPSRANQAAFDHAVARVADVAHELLDSLVTTARPRSHRRGRESAGAGRRALPFVTISPRSLLRFSLA
jgi:hypothetical protein